MMEAVANEGMEYVAELKQENERLKEEKRQLQIRNMSLEEWYFYHKEIIDKAIEYNNYLREHCKYKLNEGHLRKMNKILQGNDDNE